MASFAWATPTASASNSVRSRVQSSPSCDTPTFTPPTPCPPPVDRPLKRKALAEGAKVMLLWNLCVDEGCVNGTMGQVEAIIWADGDDPLNSIPLMVLVEIEGYAGRATVALNGKNLVPILARTQQWEQDGSTCSRTQIPLALAFAITIHKSQGLTLDQAVVNLDNKKIHMDLTYVALSRVRHITSLAIEACAPLDRFPTEQTLGLKMRINDAARRQGLPIPHQIIVPSKRKDPKDSRVAQRRPRRRRNGLDTGAIIT